MTQMRKALFLPLSLPIAVAAPAAGSDRGRVPGKGHGDRRSRPSVRGIGTMTHSDIPGAQAFCTGRCDVNPARQARETPI